MQNTHFRSLAVALTALSLITLGAWGCNRTESDGSTSDESESSASAEANASEEGGDEGDKGEAPPEDLYPRIQFEKLSADDRRTFVSAAKEELCPCPDSNESLHKCLQSSQQSCTLAKRAGIVMVQGLDAGVDKEDVLSRVADFLEQSKKTYEFDLEAAPRRGAEDAPIRIVEFADFECPHCKRASEMLKKVVEKHEGEVVHYFKHFPLPAHDKAKLAARAAVAAQKQEKFWPMHDLLFANQRSLSKEKIFRLARQIGVNFSKFKEDLMSQEVADRVKSDQQEGRNANVSGTPALFISGRQHVGGLKEEAVAEAIRAELDGENGDSGEAEEGGASDEQTADAD